MADIFISYSRKDSEPALGLANRLRVEGFDVWIDQQGIDAATSYSHEIVHALDHAEAVIVLLSQSSIESQSVIRELTLAFEAKKVIVPVNLEKVTLPTQFRYLLAGIQRAKISDFEGIVRSLAKLGLGQSAASALPEGDLLSASASADPRKALIVLPFEDHSPAQDHQWFADGLAGELIDAMSRIKSLRVLDRTTSKSLRGVQQTMKEIGVLFDTRYFVEGSVTKVNDKIKISSALIDSENGQHVWQDSMKGTMENIFDIQESVAAKVVEGLKIHLTSEEKSKLNERGTENAEAYEYVIRAEELRHTFTRVGLLQAISLLDLALALDPHYADAALEKASALFAMYNYYDHNQDLLQEMEVLLRGVEKLDPHRWLVHAELASLYLKYGRMEEAEREHQIQLSLDDGSAEFLDNLGFYCFQTMQYSRAFDYFEASLMKDSTPLVNYQNVIVNAHGAGNMEGIRRWSDRAIAAYQKRLRLHPEDDIVRFDLAQTYLWCHPPRIPESRREAEILNSSPNLDAFLRYQVTMLYVSYGDYDAAVEALSKAIAGGWERTPKRDLELAALSGHPRFEKLMRDMREKQNA